MFSGHKPTITKNGEFFASHEENTHELFIFVPSIGGGAGEPQMSEPQCLLWDISESTLVGVETKFAI